MKKFKKIIFSDKDGTLLINRFLNNILAYASAHDCLFVMCSGRTIADTNEIFKKESVGIPRYTIGDNGAIVYDNKEKKALQKFLLEKNIISNVLLKYFELGGTPQNLRYTNGENIFSFDNPNNHNYYKNSDTVKYIDRISDIEDITKITIAGNKKLMEQMSEYVSSLGCTSDIGKTGFPIKDSKQYRLDIQSEQATKGNAVKFLSEYLGIQDYSCYGNGWNDFSMFKQAIRTGNNISVMDNAPQELLIAIHNYIKELKDNGVEKIGKVHVVRGDDAKEAIIKDIHGVASTPPSNFKNGYKFTVPPITLNRHSTIKNKTIPQNGKEQI